jgi:hypothetical protein
MKERGLGICKAPAQHLPERLRKTAKHESGYPTSEARTEDVE